MTVPYRVLVIGCGRIAGLLDRPSVDGAALTHAQAYARDERFTIAACVDPSETNRARFMTTWKVNGGFDDVAGAFAGGARYDVASVCAPTALHASVLADLAARPVRAVFVEKPLLANLSEQSSIACYGMPGVPVALVNYTRRWDPEIERLKESVGRAGVGACRSVNVFYNKGARNNGSHAVHLLCHLLGLDPHSLVIDAVGRWKCDHEAADPTVDALVAAPNGMPIHFAGLDARDFAIFEIFMVFSDRIVEIRDGGNTICTRVAAPSRRYPDYRELQGCDERIGGYGRALPRALDNIAGCIQGIARPECTVDTALAVEAFCQTLIDGALARPELEIVK